MTPKRGLFAKPNSFRCGPSTRHARKLRRMVERRIEARKALAASRLARAKREAAANIDILQHRLSPEYRLRMQESLAHWEAIRDSLEDDGVAAEPKSLGA